MSPRYIPSEALWNSLAIDYVGVQATFLFVDLLSTVLSVNIVEEVTQQYGVLLRSSHSEVKEFLAEASYVGHIFEETSIADPGNQANVTSCSFTSFGAIGSTWHKNLLWRLHGCQVSRYENTLAFKTFEEHWNSSWTFLELLND